MSAAIFSIPASRSIMTDAAWTTATRVRVHVVAMSRTYSPNSDLEGTHGVPRSTGASLHRRCLSRGSAADWCDGSLSSQREMRRQVVCLRIEDERVPRGERLTIRITSQSICSANPGGWAPTWPPGTNPRLQRRSRRILVRSEDHAHHRQPTAGMVALRSDARPEPFRASPVGTECASLRLNGGLRP